MIDLNVVTEAGKALLRGRTTRERVLGLFPTDHHAAVVSGYVIEETRCCLEDIQGMRPNIPFIQAMRADLEALVVVLGVLTLGRPEETAYDVYEHRALDAVGQLDRGLAWWAGVVQEACSMSSSALFLAMMASILANSSSLFWWASSKARFRRGYSVRNMSSGRPTT